MFHAKKVYSMLDNENLRESALRCHQFLREAGIAHSVAGRHGSFACMAISAIRWIPVDSGRGIGRGREGTRGRGI